MQLVCGSDELTADRSETSMDPQTARLLAQKLAQRLAGMSASRMVWVL